MSVSASFIDLFDISAKPEFADKQTCSDYFEVKEYDAGNSSVPMTLLRIEQTGVRFTSFNHLLVQGIKDITVKRSSFLLDCDCDGIAFMTDSINEGLIFAELKSRFSTQNLDRAFMQMMYSFLKMHAMLSMCKDYSIDGIHVHFIAACQCFEDDIQEDVVYNHLNKMESLEESSFDGLFVRKLIEKNTIKVRFGDMINLWNIPLNYDLANKQITLSLQMTQNYGDDNTIFKM